MSEAPQTGQREETCRICLESSPIANSSTGSVSRFTHVEDEDRLISPCACSGTQAYVHYKCLQRWQQSVMASRRIGPGLQSPALICSVCTHKFSVAPPRPTMGVRMRKLFTSYACEVTGLLIILPSDEGFGGWLQLQDMQQGRRREQCCEWGGLVGRGKKTNPRSGPCCSTFKLGSRWWDSSSPLHAGTLLVATPAMLSPYYYGTVVLLYEHERCRGSRGIILNKQSEEGEILKWESQLFLGIQNSVALKHVSHGTGGTHKPDDWFILQRCSASPVKCKHCTAEAVRPKTCSKDWGREVLPGIFLGKDVGPVLHHLNGCKRSSNVLTSDNIKSEEECYSVDHQIIHGHAEWYVGQLGSAVRRGLWKTRENASAILLSTPPHELWHTLFSE